MAKDDFWIKFNIDDWLNDPKLRRLRRDNRDTWLTACLMMIKSGDYFLTGDVDELANLLHLTEPEFEEFYADLKRTNVADVSRRGQRVRLVSRRYKREYEAREYERLRKRNQRVPEVSRKSPGAIARVRDKSKKDLNPSLPTDASDDSPPPEDPRRSHPAIVAIVEVTGLAPPKEIWDEIVDRLGYDVDHVKLKQVFVKWRANGYKITNYSGIIDWYLNGVPKAGKTNAANRHSRQQNNAPTPGERILNRPYRRNSG